MRYIVVVLAVFFLASFVRKQKTWVAIGDSITYLNDHLTETGNRVTKGYLTRVAEALPRIRYVNQGYNGWTSGGIAESINTLGITKADIYTVFLGTNDWWQGRPLGTLHDYTSDTGNTTVYGSFRIIIGKLRRLNPKAKIILITPMQRTDFVYLSDPTNNAWGSYKEKNGRSLSQFAAAVDSIGNYEHISVVDLYNNGEMTVPLLVKYKRLKDTATGAYTNFTYPGYTSVPFNPKSDEYPYPVDAIGYTYDGLHPSDKGNALIADQLVALMKKY